MLQSWRVAGKLGGLYEAAATRDKLKPAAIWEIERGRALMPARLEEASVVRSAFYRAVLRLFEKVDMLILPTAQVFPFDVTLDWPKEVGGRAMDTYHRWMEIVVAGSMSGCPVINVPAGFSAEGLPMGLQIMAPRYAELDLLRVAHAYEQATGWNLDDLPVAASG